MKHLFFPAFAKAKSVGILSVCLGLSSLVANAADNFFLLVGNANNLTSPYISGYDSVSDLRTNTTPELTLRNTAQASTSDISIGSDGKVYAMLGDSLSSNTKSIWVWDSLSDWASNTGGVLLGSRTLGASSGFAIYNGAVYFLAGNSGVSESKTLWTWSSIANWASDTNAQSLGSRITGAGLGFEIGTDGSVYFLETLSSPLSATTATLYSWSSINNFISNTGAVNHGGSFTLPSSQPVAGLAISPVPEPGAIIAVSLGGALLLACRRFRRKG